ncbi:MAG: ABC transporter substrate-binding protein [Rhodospirillales bacterium]|nr:MAG: ABC transporter substrate-binding protein [Rhodospirillales bacterium]
MSRTLMTRRGMARLTFGVAGAAVGARTVLAQDAAGVINGAADRVLAAVKAGVTDAERERTLTAVFRDSFDIPSIARTVLGRHWNAATEEQRQRFMEAFERAEVRAYSNRFKEYGGQSLQVGKVTQNGGAQLVDAQIIQVNGPPIKLVWELVGGRIVDVSVEGISMAITRRSDFNAYIQRNGIDGLIAELKRRSG